MADLYSAATAQEEIRLGLGGRSNLTTRIQAWFDEAQLLIARCEIECPRLDAVVHLFTQVGVAEYSLLAAPWSNPNNIIGLRLLKNVSSGINLRLFRFDFDEYRSLSSQASGPPTQWARHGTTLAFDPVPDQIYDIQVDYRRRPAAQTVEVDSEYQTILIDLAIYLGFRRLQEWSKAQAHFSLLPAWLQVRLQQPLTEQDWEKQWDEPQAIPGNRRYD